MIRWNCFWSDSVKERGRKGADEGRDDGVIAVHASVPLPPGPWAEEGAASIISISQPASQTPASGSLHG